MMAANRIIRPFAVLLAVGLLAALLIPLAIRPSHADQQTISIAPGDRLTVTCTTGLSGTIQGTQSVIECAAPAPTQASAASGPAITQIKGVQDGGTLSGKVNVEAIVSGQNIATVVFKLETAGQQPVIHTEKNTPYFFLGDNNGVPNGWDTTKSPDGDYMLTITATDQAGRSAAITVRFKIANSAQPTAQPSPQPTTVPAPTATPSSGGDETPVAGQPCPAWVHDRYVTTGPDGKQYPTWHPPVDPEYQCYFGHEHGDDPHTSVLFNEVGMPPFGYVNAIEGQRKEDHVGNKVFVVNDDTRSGSLLVKLHQGTHSPDAFVNNLHELQYHYRNQDGRKLDVMILAAFGRSGEVNIGCGANGTQTIKTGTPTNNLGSGIRSIPSADCYVLPHIPYEDWLSGNHITTPDGRELAYFDPHFAVFNPSRYFAPGLANNLGRSVDRCRELSGTILAECQAVKDNATITWDTSASPFKGEHREMYVNQNQVQNAAGPNVWYCDPYGGNASTKPFAGSIPQYISSSQYTQVLNSLVFGRDNNHDAPGVHSPN
jgi:hypothetical protein